MNKYLHKNWLPILSNGLIFWILIMLYFMFHVLHSESDIYELNPGLNLMTIELSQPLYTGGKILVFGLGLMLIFKIFQKNWVVIIIGIITILLYYFVIKIVGL